MIQLEPMQEEEDILTRISSDEHCRPPKVAAGRHRVPLVISVESIGRMSLDGIWIVAAPRRLNRRTICSTNAARIVQRILERGVT